MIGKMKRLFLIFVFFIILVNNILAQYNRSTGKSYTSQNNFQQLKVLAESGDITTQLQLANMYFYGKGVLIDKIQAFNWFTKAAEAGNSYAQCALAYCYLNGDGTAPNDFLTFKWAKSAAEKGEQEAYGLLSYCYFWGHGTVSDKIEAVKFAKLGASSNDKLSLYILGFAYKYGLGTITDQKQAFNNLWLASEQNVPDALNELAYMYALGKGCSKNKAKAIETIDKAIELQPNNLNYYDTKGDIYLLFNETNKAIQLANFILDNDKDFARNNTHLMNFYKSSNDSRQTANEFNAKDVPHNTIQSDINSNIPILKKQQSDVFAVIIANEIYQVEKPVQYAENDGKTFEEYCKKTLGLPEKNVHFIKNATLNNIKHEIKWLQDVIAVYNGNAKVIFYYAGHGIPDEQNKSAYLLPIDGYGTDVTTGYALEDLYKALGSLPSKSITVFLDACFSGAKRDGDMLASARGVAIKVKQSNPTGNMVVFTAAQGDETAYPYKEEGHGLFTYFLLKKLQKTKGDVTLGELGDYIKTQVERQSIVTNGKLQSPSILPASSIGNSWKEWKLNK